MASPVGYQPFCPLGAALNAIGDRWALLVVRDLMLGPRRYSDLLHGLGGVGTDILAARLRSLQEAGVVRKVGSGRASRYELTDSGKDLRQALVELARWGARRVQLPDDLAKVPPRVPLGALMLGAEALPGEANGIYTFRVADETVHVEVTLGIIVAAPENSAPSAIITMTLGGLRSFVLGTPVSDIEGTGDLSIEGNRRAAVAVISGISNQRLLVGLRTRSLQNS